MAMSPRTRPLTRDEVIGAALQIVDDEGLEALSMRRLGSALGVEAMALYRHVRNKDALVDLTVDRMRSEMRLADDLPDDPAVVMEAIFIEYRRVLLNHPNMLPLAARRTDTGGPSGLAYLIEHGLDPETAVSLYQSLLAFTLGYSVLGAQRVGADWPGMPDDIADRLGEWKDTTFRRTISAVMAGHGLIQGD
jgi:TetR/AcrR family transcriptional regulator, tetracycline repressor protein